MLPTPNGSWAYCIARSIGRARIETAYAWGSVGYVVVSPDQLVGRGLKLIGADPGRDVRGIARSIGRARIETFSPAPDTPRRGWYRPINWSGAD